MHGSAGDSIARGVHGYLRELLELEVTAALGRLRYDCQAEAKSRCNGHRTGELIGALGRMQIESRARVADARVDLREFKRAHCRSSDGWRQR